MYSKEAIICHKYTLFETGILYGCVTSLMLDSQHSMHGGMM
jgi:hypothetical protein